MSWRDRIGNVADSLRWLTHVCERGELTICGTFEYVGSRFDADWITEAARQAKAAGANFILGEATDRLIRHVDFESDSTQRVNLRATEQQLKELAKAAGMPLVTHLDADADGQTVRSYQRKRGQWAKQRKGGRRTAGWKKRQKQKLLPRVRFLGWLGESSRSIEQQTGVPFRTVCRWLSLKQKEIEI